MTLDGSYGVPTVMMHTEAFGRIVKSVVGMNGMPRMRAAYVPMPVMGKTPAELRAYVNGSDPLTGQPVMQEIIEGLTGALSAEDLAGQAFELSATPRLVESDATEDELHALFLANTWTDTLPIVLPTEERVAAMLKHTSHQPDEVIGRMRGTAHGAGWAYTVEKVAVNAVMAGARPEYFPVILALAASGRTARGTSTSSSAAMVVVNGPIRQAIGMNSGVGAMGPYNHANATIGRAYSLLSQNLSGGSVPGISYMGSQGNAYSFTNLTFAENEESSPFQPFHVAHGFSPTDSTVSIFGFCWHTAFAEGLPEADWSRQVKRMLLGLDARSRVLFVLDPRAARQFVERGLDTREKLLDWAWETAQIPAGEYWDYQLIQNYVYPRATFGDEPYASMLKVAPADNVHMFPRDSLDVVVAGGETGPPDGYWRIISADHSRTLPVDPWR
jgi:hypothetical protein